MELDFLIDPPPREVSGTARGLQPHAERWSPFLAEHARNCMIDRIVYIEPTSLRVSITSFPSPLRSELGSTQGSQLGNLLFDFEYSLHIVFIAFLPAGRIPLHQMAWTGLRLVHFGARGPGENIYWVHRGEAPFRPGEFVPGHKTSSDWGMD